MSKATERNKRSFPLLFLFLFHLFFLFLESTFQIFCHLISFHSKELQSYCWVKYCFRHIYFFSRSSASKFQSFAFFIHPCVGSFLPLWLSEQESVFTGASLCLVRCCLSQRCHCFDYVVFLLVFFLCRHWSSSSVSTAVQYFTVFPFEIGKANHNCHRKTFPFICYMLFSFSFTVVECSIIRSWLFLN